MRHGNPSKNYTPQKQTKNHKMNMWKKKSYIKPGNNFLYKQKCKHRILHPFSVGSIYETHAKLLLRKDQQFPKGKRYVKVCNKSIRTKMMEYFTRLRNYLKILSSAYYGFD